jgi:CheY-like chemotaxis protein
MMFAPESTHQSPLRLAPHPKPRLLLVSDNAERVGELRRSINPVNFEIACAASLDELRAACCEGHDLVALDVGAPQIAPTLKLLRASDGHKDSLLLVESTRLNNDPNLIGLLPTYRAMPCSHGEILTLIRYLHEADTVRPTQRGVL